MTFCAMPSQSPLVKVSSPFAKKSAVGRAVPKPVDVKTARLVTLVLAMPAAVQVGDTFSIVAGCRKRLEDCRDKFDNVLNFRGEPHRPGVDALTAAPESTA